MKIEQNSFFFFCHIFVSSCQEIAFFRQQHILDLLLEILFVHNRHYEDSLPYRQVNKMLVAFDKLVF
jgi:hypothetical protein